MKTFRTIFPGGGFRFFLPALLTLAGCSQSATDDVVEPDPGPAPAPETVTLTLSAPATRTQLQNDCDVVWEAGDRIFISGDGGQWSVFDVVPDADNPTRASVYDVPAASVYEALYARSVAEEEGLLLITFPQVQPYRSGGFGQYAAPMYACGSGTTLDFKNLTGIIRLAVTGEGTTLASVSLKDNDNSWLNGTMAYDRTGLTEGTYAPCEMHFDPSASSAQLLTLDCAEGVTLSSEPAYLYFATIPGRYEHGFTVTLTDTEGRICTRSTTQDVEVRRSEIKDMEPFAFDIAADMEITTGSATGTSIDYRIRTEPNAMLRTLLVSRSCWDDYLAGGSFTEETLPRAILNQIGSTVQADGEGLYAITATTAYDNGICPLWPETEYYILASYADGDGSAGTILRTEVRTGAAAGTPPEMTVQLVEQTQTALGFRIRTQQADQLFLALFTRDSFDRLSQNQSIPEIIRTYATAQNISIVEQANGADGALRRYSLDEDTEYVLVAGARSREGAMNTFSDSYRTLGWNWSVVSTSGSLDCGLFSEIAGIPLFTVHGLQVEKAADQDAFRVKDPFCNQTALDALAAGTEEFSRAEGTYYMIIDANDPDQVQVLSFTPTGLDHLDLGTIFVSSLKLVSSAAGSSFGTYYPDEGRIDLGDLALHSQQYLLQRPQTPTVLHIYGSSAPSGALSTESFRLDSSPTTW